MEVLGQSEQVAGSRAWKLVLQHGSVADRVCCRLVRRTPHLRAHLPDLVQEALLGLHRAALTYAPERGSFETWAWWWAMSSAKRAARAALNPMTRIPRRVQLARFGPESLDELGEAGTTFPNPETVAEAHLLAAKLQRFLESRRGLRASPGASAPAQPRRDVQIFLRRLVGEESLASIGAGFGGLSRERVRQLEVAVTRDFDAFASVVRSAA